MKRFLQILHRYKKYLSYGHLLIAGGHLIMEICFDNFSDPFEAGVTLALTLTAIFLSILVILDEKK